MNETNTDQKQKPKTSRLAIASIVFLAVPFLLIVLLIFLLLWLKNLEFPNWLEVTLLVVPLGSLLIALILGIAALIQIKRSNGLLAGKWRAIIAIVLPVIMIWLASPIFTPWRAPSRIVCGTCVKGLGTVFEVYAYEYDDRLPTAESWCDLFVAHEDVDPKQFRCPESDVIIGESAYALNENIVGMKLSEIPGDVVLMFETSLGRTDGARTGQVKSRGYFQFFTGPEPPEMYSQEQKKEGDRKIYIHRWNQVGGPEDLTTQYHKDIGCNILFADGHADFVKKEGLDTLRWEP